MSKKVFVVTAGSYSDYGIRAMFSTRKLALQYIDKAVALQHREEEQDGLYIGNVYWAADARVEVWKLDSESTARLYDYWLVGMLLDDGSIVEPVNQGREFGHPASVIQQCGDRVPCYQERPIVRTKSCKSGEHAIKLAAEARQEWLRKNAAKPETFLISDKGE